MNFLEIAQARQSCRAYEEGKAVESEKLEAILEAKGSAQRERESLKTRDASDRERYAAQRAKIQVYTQQLAETRSALEALEGSQTEASEATAAITELCSGNSNVRIVPIDGAYADAMKAKNPFYTTYTIKAGTYTGQTEDVTTVAIKATLIVSAAASEEDVYNLTKAIFDNVETITANHAKGAELTLENATEGMDVPFHAGAAKYFAEKGIEVAK